VTGEVIPSLPEIEKVIDESLTLSNWRWPRSTAVRGIALALRRWACADGLAKAAERGKIILEGEPMEYADLLNLPWIPREQIEPLTPEAFADRIGGIVDDIERNAGSDKDSGGEDQRVLPGAGAACEGDRAGGEPAGDGSAGGYDQYGDGGPEEGSRVLEFPRQRRDRGTGREQGLSRRQVVEELHEHQVDLDAFYGGYKIVRKRVQEAKDDARLMKLANWSGTDAVMGSLEMAVHAIERTVEELKDILRKIDSGVIPNLDEDEHG
jgi:hypothetical protein